MPRKRNTENRGLPARWVLKHGAYYYLPPTDLRDQWDGKSWFFLGKRLSDAYKVWAERISAPDRITTIGALLERFTIEVIPNKAPKTQIDYRRYVVTLSKTFGHVLLADLEPQHIYQYVDKRSAKTAAHREIEVLSAAFTKAVQWGLIKAHPFKGEVRLEGEKARTRYVEDWELEAAMALPSRRKKGSVAMVQAYLRLKLLTGLRQRDLLLLTMSQLMDDGIHVTPSKTARSTGKKLIYEWTTELKDAVEQAKSVRPAISPYLFCNRFGACYVDIEKGTAGDWNNIWQKFMARVLKDTEVKERFTEHDLRAKVGSDAETLERAKQLLAHSDQKLTERIYRRRPEKIKPAR
jgi:integrase